MHVYNFDYSIPQCHFRPEAFALPGTGRQLEAFARYEVLENEKKKRLINGNTMTCKKDTLFVF